MSKKCVNHSVVRNNVVCFCFFNKKVFLIYVWIQYKSELFCQDLVMNVSTN